MSRGGLSCREAARRRGVSPTTACKWWRRWSEATLEQRRSLVCLEDRSSRPHQLAAAPRTSEQKQICAARRRSGWGRPRLIVGETRSIRTSTVWRTLQPVGSERSRPRQGATRDAAAVRVALPRRSGPRRQQELGRIARPGHRVIGRSAAARLAESRLGPVGRVPCTSASTTRPDTPTAEVSTTNAARRQPASSSAASPGTASSGSRCSG